MRRHPRAEPGKSGSGWRRASGVARPCSPPWDPACVHAHRTPNTPHGQARRRREMSQASWCGLSRGQAPGASPGGATVWDRGRWPFVEQREEDGWVTAPLTWAPCWHQCLSSSPLCPEEGTFNFKPRTMECQQ